MAVTMNTRWDNNGTVIPVGDAEYVVAEQPIAEYDNWFNYNIVADIQAVIDDVINKFNANTILKADTDNTPAALVVAEQTIVGRKTGNSIAALTDAEVLVIIGVEAGATADQTNTEIRDAVEAAADSNTFTDTDHTKLNGIEALATTDQTNNEIRDAVEAAVDSNTFADADHTKLNGIETGADVTKVTDGSRVNVYSAAAPTSWTGLDLSAVVGSGTHLVALRVHNTVAANYVGFRTNGDTDICYSNTSYPQGVQSGWSTNAANTYTVFIVLTDSSGVIEWRATNNFATTLDVMWWI